jgi:ATP-dependent RNA helicase MRH4, mitochondrial
LFAHEGLGGAYEFADDRFDHHALDDSDSGRSRSSSRNFTFEELDLNDPTIEKFPSDRGAVMNTLRKIQSSSSQDYAATDDLSKSPRAYAKNLGVAIDDGGRQSNGSLSPASPNSSRRRDGRASMSSFGRSKSPASLGCIDEEPKASSIGQSICPYQMLPVAL